MNPNTEREERLAKIQAARETGVLPWSHLSSPAQQFKMAAETLDYLLSLLDSQAAGEVTPTTPLLQKIVEIADLGSAKEFGDALERLTAIRGLIVGENV